MSREHRLLEHEPWCLFRESVKLGGDCACDCGVDLLQAVESGAERERARTAPVIEALRHLRAGCGTFYLAGRGRDLWHALDKFDGPQAEPPPATNWKAVPDA